MSRVFYDVRLSAHDLSMFNVLLFVKTRSAFVHVGAIVFVFVFYRHNLIPLTYNVRVFYAYHVRTMRTDK